MKYRARWYNADSVVAGLHDNEIIEANSAEEATKIAYQRENGNPPAPMLWLEEDMDDLDISYNYINVIIPTIQATF